VGKVLSLHKYEHGSVVVMSPRAADAPPFHIGAHGRAPLRPPLRPPDSLAAGRAPLRPPLRPPHSLAAGRAPLRPPLRSPRSLAAGRVPLRPPLRPPDSLGSFIAGPTQAGSHPPLRPEARPLHRRSIRLRGYDYRQAGAYFVTIVAHNRTCLFGDILGGDMRLSSAGHAAQEQWLRSSDIREEIELDAFVVMPNHLHGIVVVKSHSAADAPPIDVGAHGRAPLRPPLRSPRSLGSFIAGFKASATKCINAARGTPGAPVWQRNYHEHIIRNEDSLNRIRQYILDNPASWSMDRENPTSINPEPEGAWRV